MRKKKGSGRAQLTDEKTVWHKAWFCIDCESELTYKQVMNAHGVCVHCGRMASGTVCDVLAKSRRWVYVGSVGQWEYKR